MQPMKFMKLEGNYIVAFRDTADECLPAFTAVRLDRAQRRLRTETPESSPTLRRRRSPPGEATLVITGVPSYVPLELIRGRLDDCIPGIVRVYREKQTSTLPKPPILVQTNRSIAVDAFMLTSKWVRVIDHIVEMASARVPQITIDEVDGDSDKFVMLSSSDFDAESNSLCPHGNILAAGTCLQCLGKNGRRSTFISDVQLFRSGRKGSEENVSPVLEKKSIGGLYELKKRRKSSYEASMCLDGLFKSR